MIKRTIEISQQPVHVTVKHAQLQLVGRDEAHTPLASIPCEDIGLLLVDECGTTYTHAALATLLEHDAAVVLCGRKHLPVGLLLPLGEHSQVVWRIHDQLAVKRPLRKQLWQQIVRAKIAGQACNLAEGSTARARLVALIRQVRSGDPENVEGQAARFYWPALFDDPAFRRDADGDGVNALLNYGYAVMRAALARAIVGAGLLPALGIHHANRSNAFCLADDLVEPLRPMVDARVRDLARMGQTELAPSTKRGLLELLAAPAQSAGQRGPLLVSLQRYVASLVKCFEGTAQRLDVPAAVAMNEPGTPGADEAEPA